MTTAAEIVRDARFTKSGDRRFLLTRRWVEEVDTPYVLFVMLNPSTANAVKDDPTIRKCMAYAKRWGYGALHVVNLFDFITSDPEELRRWVAEKEKETLLSKHDWNYLDIIEGESHHAAITICGWGTWGGWFPERARKLYARLSRPHALRVTKDGHPGHPLYLPADAGPKPYFHL